MVSHPWSVTPAYNHTSLTDLVLQLQYAIDDIRMAMKQGQGLSGVPFIDSIEQVTRWRCEIDRPIANIRYAHSC